MKKPDYTRFVKVMVMAKPLNYKFMDLLLSGNRNRKNLKSGRRLNKGYLILILFLLIFGTEISQVTNLSHINNTKIMGFQESDNIPSCHKSVSF